MARHSQDGTNPDALTLEQIQTKTGTIPPQPMPAAVRRNIKAARTGSLVVPR